MKTNLPPKLLVVENEMIIAADISLQLSKLGYEVIGINTRAEDALKTIQSNRPDIILMDIGLQGKMDGITAAKFILNHYRIPVIFLSSNTDEATFKRAITAQPYTFISKPFKKSDLQRGIEMTLDRMAIERKGPQNKQLKFSKRLLIRQKKKLIKVATKDIQFVEANRNYCKLFMGNNEYKLTVPLRNIEAQLPICQFMRVHRSFVVNMDKVDTINENGEFLTIKKYKVPISRRLREIVMNHFKMI